MSLGKKGNREEGRVMLHRENIHDRMREKTRKKKRRQRGPSGIWDFATCNAKSKADSGRS